MTTIKKTFLSALCTFVCTLFVSSAIAQTPPYKVNDEVCARKGVYDRYGTLLYYNWATCRVIYTTSVGFMDLKVTDASGLSKFKVGEILSGYTAANVHGGQCQGYVEIFVNKNYQGSFYEDLASVIYVENVGANGTQNLGSCRDPKTGFPIGMNDKMSSLKWKLQPNVTATIWAHNPPGGRHFNLNGSGGIDNCHPHHINGSDWCGGDCASAISFTTQ